MEKYIVIATVDDKDYMVKLEADSLSAAEHKILDQSVCGKHTYGVTACQSYGLKEMQNDHFASRALFAETVSVDELSVIIKKRNEEIKRQDKREDDERRLAKLGEKIAELSRELECLKEDKKALEWALNS